MTRAVARDELRLGRWDFPEEREVERFVTPFEADGSVVHAQLVSDAEVERWKITWSLATVDERAECIRLWRSLVGGAGLLSWKSPSEGSPSLYSIVNEPRWRQTGAICGFELELERFVA